MTRADEELTTYASSFSIRYPVWIEVLCKSLRPGLHLTYTHRRIV